MIDVTGRSSIWVMSVCVGVKQGTNTHVCSDHCQDFYAYRHNTQHNVDRVFTWKLWANLELRALTCDHKAVSFSISKCHTMSVSLSVSVFPS